MLGLFSAVVTCRLRCFRIEAAGVQIAFFGGTAAAVFLAFSAVGSWSLSQPGVASDAGAMRAVQLLSFSAGESRTRRRSDFSSPAYPCHHWFTD